MTDTEGKCDVNIHNVYTIYENARSRATKIHNMLVTNEITERDYVERLKKELIFFSDEMFRYYKKYNENPIARLGEMKFIPGCGASLEYEYHPYLGDFDLQLDRTLRYVWHNDNMLRHWLMRLSDAKINDHLRPIIPEAPLAPIPPILGMVTALCIYKLE